MWWFRRETIKQINKVKVKCFPGATINNVFHYLKPLLEKKPDYVSLHVSTNDAITKTLMELKLHIENTLPSCVVIILEPTNKILTAQKQVSQSNI